MKATKSKSEETKKRILEAALELFIEKGYEKSTMREIAKQAGMTPGATYYYFPSKDHLIFHYYTQSHQEHLFLVEEILLRETDLAKRIGEPIKANIRVATPYQEMSRVLFKTAADPSHPLSPFSEESRSLREKDIEVFRRVIQGSKTKVPKEFIDKLPRLLWLYKMGIVLYWLFDRSENQRKTFELIDQTSAMVVRLIQLSKIPGIKSFSLQMVKVIEYFVPE